MELLPRDQRYMEYDRAKEVKAFDESKAGIKGLLDSGVNKVPRIFIRPRDELEADKLNNVSHIDLQVPIIDLNHLQVTNGRESIIKQVLYASQEWGFLQVVNHGIPLSVLNEAIGGIRKFHEQNGEAKKPFYSRDQQKLVRYECNYDLFRSRAANWRDTLNVSMPHLGQFDPNELPDVCRTSTMEYIDHVTNLGDTLFELLSEALGLKPDKLKSIECAKEKHFVFHYYPPCPEPDLTLGTMKHTDPSFITILLQDQLGGLQVIHENQWINVKPIAGALVVNIGDLLQIVSNDKFKSVEHRVVANINGPRISTACFFNGAVAPPRLYGPIEELISQESPKLFKDFTVGEFLTTFFSKPIETARVDIFRV